MRAILLSLLLASATYAAAPIPKAHMVGPPSRKAVLTFARNNNNGMASGSIRVKIVSYTGACVGIIFTFASNMASIIDMITPVINLPKRVFCSAQNPKAARPMMMAQSAVGDSGPIKVMPVGLRFQ